MKATTFTSIAMGLAVLTVVGVEDRPLSYGSSRFVFDQAKTRDLSIRDKIPLPANIIHVKINALKRDMVRPSKDEVGVVFSKISGVRGAKYIRGTNILLSKYETDLTESVVFTTNGPLTNGGESCSRKIIDGYYTTYTCRPLDEKDKGWIRNAAIQAGYATDFPLAHLPYTPPEKMTISGATRQLIQRNVQMEAFRNK